MSILGPPCRSFRLGKAIPIPTSSSLHSTRRHVSQYTKNASTLPKDANPLLSEYYSKKEARERQRELAERAFLKNRAVHMPEESIFDELRRSDKQLSDAARREKRELKKKEGPKSKLMERNLDHMNWVLDPVPEEHEKWMRDKVIEQVRNDGKLTKEEWLKRTERSCVSKSAQLKTSMKKLGFLARQITGKTIDEAILQMRFSKKKSALEIIKHLEHSKNLAIVSWGMGLGKAEGRMGEPVSIQLKDGTWKNIMDRTEIYIDQAWVNKGHKHLSIDYRARGRGFTIIHPYARLNLLLKEQATRIREAEEREHKKKTAKFWMPLPDRPIPHQRQYLLW